MGLEKAARLTNLASEKVAESFGVWIELYEWEIEQWTDQVMMKFSQVCYFLIIFIPQYLHEKKITKVIHYALQIL